MAPRPTTAEPSGPDRYGRLLLLPALPYRSSRDPNSGLVLVSAPVCSMSAARSLAESASDWTFCLPDSTVCRVVAPTGAPVSDVVGRAVPYSSHWLRLARRRAISALAAPTAAPATSSPPMIFGQRLTRGSSLINFALPLRAASS